MVSTLEILGIAFLLGILSLVLILWTRYYYFRNRDILLKINEKKKGIYKRSLLMMGGKIFFENHDLIVEVGAMFNRLGHMGYVKIKLNQATDKKLSLSSRVKMLEIIKTNDDAFDSKIYTRSNDENFALDFLNDKTRKNFLDMHFPLNFSINYNKKMINSYVIGGIFHYGIIRLEELETLIDASLLFAGRLKEMKIIT